MANRIFRAWAQAMLTTGGPNLSTADLKVCGIDISDIDPNTAIGQHDFLDDIAAGVVDTTLDLANVTVVDGVLDADDVALPDTGGDAIDELVIYADTGTPSTSRLLILIDTASGLPISRDSVADSIQWHATGIFAITG